MAINPNNGVLDIINGTLKVSSIDIKQAAGFTTTLNTIARNDVLLFDDQKASTVFTPTSEGGYMSSTGVTRDTTEGAGYIDLNDGWVYWPIQLPNSWHTEFDMHVTTTGGVLTFSLFNTSEPNHTDYTNNDGGYKIVFDNTTNKLILYYEGSPHKLGDVNIRSPDWQHVNINYFQGAISVSLAGKVVLTHEFTQNYQEFNSRYVGFSATTGASHKIRHLRVHNSDKWLYTKTSNASDITYVSGNVGIGTLTPTELLDVHGNVHIAKDLTVNGNLTVSGTTTFIDTQNLAIEDPIIEVARGNASDTIDAGLVITRATSNVAVAYRGDEEELALGYTQSGASDTDVTPITDGGLDVRVYGNLFANNLTTTANVEATYLKGNGSEITHVTLDQVVDYGNTTANTIHLTNTDVGLKADGNVDASYFIGNGSKLTGLVTDLQSVTDNGNVTSNTVQFTNATTAFVADSNVGIGTDTPAANLHVVGYQYVNDPPTIANSFDHSDAPLTLTHGTPTSTTAVDDPKAVLHLTRDGTDGESYGSKASFKMSRYENSGTASRSRLDVALTDGTYTESTVMTLRADGKVGIGTTAPGYTLDVRGTANVGALTATSISGPLSGNADTATSLETARTIGGESFDGTANIDLPGVNTVGTQNTSGNAATATALETARTIGGESFDGTANIDLPGVNTAGTQNTSGNAATATALETARTIGGESFDGTANIDLPGVNTAGTQNTSGNADTATTATNQSGGTVSATTGTFSGNVGIGTTSPATYLHLSAKNGDPGSTEGDLVGTHTLTEYLRFTSRGDVGDVNGVTVGFKLGGDDNSSVNPDGRLDICANDGASAGNEYGLTPDRTIATFLGSGNVGIGTTSPSHPLTIQETTTNTNTVTYPLAIRAISSGTVANGFGAGIRFQCERRDTDDYQSLAGSVEVYGGGNLPGTSDLWNMRFGVRNNDTAVTPMTLRYDGNVGIGTTNPEYKLDVSGTGRFTGTVTATSYRLTGDATPYKQSIKNDTNLAVGWYRIAENGNAVDTDANGSRCSARFTIIDYDSGLHSTRTLYAGGTYGNKPFIHLLTNTSYGGDGNISKVRVVEGSTYEGLAVEIYVDTACSTNEIRIVMDDNYQVSGFTMVNFESVVANHSNMNEYELNLNTTFWGMFLDNTTTNICMLESGNVGIGESSPSYKLHVNGTSQFESEMRWALGSHVSHAGHGGNKDWYIRSGSSSGKVILQDSGGNVGIGTASPAYKLDVSGDLAVSGKIYNYNYTEVDINAPATTSGSWTTANSSSWGDPKFNNTYDRYRYNDAPGYVEYTIPTGMKSAYLSQLQWNNGGYVDVHGVQADGDLIFLRRINTIQAVENSNHANPDQHDGSTITFVGSGLQYFTKIRLTNKKGRFHLTGLAFTPNENEGTEGTGMVHTAQISDLSGHPVQYVGQNVHDIVVYGNSAGRYITPLDITITPKFSNSKIMLHWVINAEAHHDQVFRVYRGSSLIGFNSNNQGVHSGAAPVHHDTDHNSTMNTHTVAWVDTPNTTSAVTYRIFSRPSNNGTNWFRLNRTVGGGSLGQSGHEIAVSYKSATEIAV
jgi:hypothetical protein